jgi:glycosyltransferase involved in cell wall biosynthesis
LIVVQLPPPIHGASVVNKAVADSSVLRGLFEIQIVPIDVTNDLLDIRKFSMRKVFRSIRVFVRVLANVIFKRPELAYLTFAPKGYAFYRDCFFVVLFRVFFIPHVLHLHGRGMKTHKKGTFSARLAKYILSKATIVHLSPRLMEDIAPFVTSRRVRFVPNGVDDPGTFPNATETFDQSTRTPTILFLSTMLESKGPMILLEALRILSVQKLKFRAVFAGPWRGSLKSEDFEDRIAQSGLLDQVCHLGPVYGEAKMAAFASADIFAFPTNYENEAFPLVVLEAMAAGLVPVTSNIAALPDIVDDSGFVVPPNDAASLALALGKLLTDPQLLRSLKIKARKKYETEFTKQRFEFGLAEVLLGAASEERTVA